MRIVSMSIPWEIILRTLCRYFTKNTIFIFFIKETKCQQNHFPSTKKCSKTLSAVDRSRFCLDHNGLNDCSQTGVRAVRTGQQRTEPLRLNDKNRLVMKPIFDHSLLHRADLVFEISLYTPLQYIQ